MAKLQEANALDYRQSGDTIDDFAQKYMSEMARVYQFLNNIRTHSTDGDVYVAPEPYQFIAESNTLYAYNSKGERVKLGKFEPNFGLVSNQIGAFLGGALSARPTTANEGDFYFSTDNATIYRYNGTAWKLYQTMDVTQLEGYEDVITEDHVTTATDTSTIYTKAQTIPRTNDNGLLPFSILGNAARIAGKKAEISSIQDGQVLTYRAATDTWRNENKGGVGDSKALSVVDGDELKAVYAGTEEVELNLGDLAAALEPTAPDGNITSLQGLLNAFAYQLNGLIGKDSWEDTPTNPDDVVATVKFGSAKNIINTFNSKGTLLNSMTVTDVAHAVNADKATNDVNGYALTSRVSDLSISGRTITVTKGDGTTKTLTTQDTTYSSLKNPNALTIQANGSTLGSYDGSSAKTFNITAASVGATAAATGGITAASLGTNGYVKFSNGLIIQWGYGKQGVPSRNVTFPISFPSTALQMIAVPQKDSTSDMGFHYLYIATLTKDAFVISDATGSSFRYIALGY